MRPSARNIVSFVSTSLIKSGQNINNFAKEVLVGDFKIAQVGEYLHTRNIQYCVAPMVFPTDLIGQYGLYHYEGHKYNKDSDKLKNMLEVLCKSNQDKELNSIIYNVPNGESLWDELFAKRFDNLMEVEEILLSFDIKPTIRYGSVDKIFTDGRDVMQLNMYQIIKNKDLFKNQQDCQK